MILTLRSGALWGLLGVFSVFASTVKAQPISNPDHLVLQSGNYEVPGNIDGFIQNPEVSSQDLFAGVYFRIVQFNEIPNKANRDLLAANGINLIAYLPHRAYFVAFDQNANLNLLADHHAIGVIVPQKEHKLTRKLNTGDYPVWAIQGKGGIEVNVSYYSNLEGEAVKAALSGQGWSVSYFNPFGHYMRVQLPIKELTALTSLPYVMFVESIDPPGEPENYTGRTLHRSSSIATNYTYANGRHYDGTGVSVMMQDDGFIGPHIDYQGRLPDQFVNFNTGDHGDHVAGIIMGAGNIDPKAKGQAFGADLYVYGAAGQGYPGFDSISFNDHYQDLDIRITSTSYSNGCNAGYTALARTMDQQVRTYPALMHVFSAGNSNNNNCGYGAGNQWGNVTGGHKIGKNVIAVANLDLSGGLANSSSRGPAHDGRIKPDVSAKGSSVNSTTNDNDYTLKSGTSMSCPGTSGVMAQLYHAFRDHNNGNDPDGGLMKAIMMNTCDDLGNVGPDYKFGWGQINALRAVRAIENTTYFEDDVAQGGSNVHAINVPNGTELMKVMVYWTDVEATANANVALINNLDMSLQEPGGTTHLPWILDPTPNVITLDNPATTGVDNLNNVEQVALTSPAAGSYSLVVSGTNVPSGPQHYYVVYEFQTAEIQLTYPIGGEFFVPSEGELIRWDAHGNSGNFTLEYSSNNGANWTTINSNISGDLREFSWTPTSTVTGEALMRVSRNGASDMSDTTFNVIRVPTGLSIDYVCPDSTRFVWNTVNNATGYEVSMLGQKYMDAIGTSTTNSLIVSGLNPSQPKWWSVKASGINNAIGRRAEAIYVAGGLINCNLAFDAELVTIVSPAAGTFLDCEGDVTIPVSIEVENTASTNVFNFPVSYQIDNDPIETEMFNITITPGNTAVVTFTDSVTLSNGAHTMTAWVDFQFDQNPYNDTSDIEIDVITGNVVTPPWSEDFDLFVNCDVASNCDAGVCALSNNFINDVNGSVDDSDWRTHNGGTPTGTSGPTNDHTQQNNSGKYLYIESSLGQTGCQASQANLTTPCIDLAGMADPKLIFYYHMSGNNMGDLHVDVESGGIWTMDVTPVISGNQGNFWQLRTVDLSAFSGQIVNIRFRGITGNGFNSDIAIDDISIEAPPVAHFTWISPTQFNSIVFQNLHAWGTSFVWNFGDGGISNDENPTHMYATPGNYDVTLIVSNNCGADTVTYRVNITPTGINDNDLLEGISVFPNPSNGLFQYAIENPEKEAMTLRVTDVTGRVIEEVSVSAGQLKVTGTLDITAEAAGLYHLEVNQGDSRRIVKLGVH